MTTDELLAAINAVETDLNLNQSVYNSPGFAHAKDLVARLKADKFMQDTFCKLFGVLPAALPELLATVDRALLLEDQLIKNTPARIALIDKIKARPHLLWVVAQLL